MPSDIEDKNNMFIKRGRYNQVKLFIKIAIKLAKKHSACTMSDLIAQPTVRFFLLNMFTS